MEFINIQQFGEETQYLHLFIITISITWIFLVLLSYKRYGVKKTIRYFVPMMISAFFLETAAVAMGKYTYPGYLIYISFLNARVPLIILFGWSTNLFLLMHMGGRIVEQFYNKYNKIQIALISIFAGLFGVCLDLLEDPLAHHNHWWIWDQSSKGVTIQGVPFSNFVGWFVILFYMTFATLIIERSGFSENRKLLLSFFSLTLVGTAMLATHLAILKIFSFIS